MNRRHAALAAVGLANACVLDKWATLRLARSPDAYFVRLSQVEVWSTIITVLLVAAVAFVGLVAAESHRPRRVRWVGISLLALIAASALTSLRLVIGHSPLEHPGRWNNGLLAGVVLLAIVFRRDLGRLAITAGLFLVPLAALSAWQAGSALLCGCLPETGGRVAEEHRFPAAVDGTRLHRTVLLVFDELDYELAFERQVAGPLPNFEQLRKQSLWADSAFAAALATSLSIPSLVTGEIITRVSPEGPGSIRLSTATGTERRLRDEGGLFTRAHARGARIAVAGWYHPYCRLFAATVAACRSNPSYHPFRGEKVLSTAVRTRLGELDPFAARRRHIATTKIIVDASVQMGSDESYDLAFLHLPIPHMPAYYDATRDRFTTLNFGAYGYQDNLLLADRVLGTLRAEMERRGVWEGTNLLVTSDHGLRYSDEVSGWRVPLAIKLAGQREAFDARGVIVAPTIPCLVLELLNGEPPPLDRLDEWIARFAQTGEVDADTSGSAGYNSPGSGEVHPVVKASAGRECPEIPGDA